MKSVVALIVVAIVVLAGLGMWQRGQIAANAAASSATTTSAPRAPVAPDIISDTWFNSPTLALADLRGKVVVVEFWTFG